MNFLLKMICRSPDPVYDIHNPLGFCLLTRLRLGLIHVNEHKFNHNFKNCLNPLCTYSLEIESASHFFLHYDHYNNIRSTLLNELKSLDGNILKLPDTTLTNLILYGGSQFNMKQNTFILNAVIKYILESNQFNGSLFQYGTELIHSKTILEITVEIEPQPAALDFKNLSKYSSHSK